jgi:hypothetical protein
MSRTVVYIVRLWSLIGHATQLAARRLAHEMSAGRAMTPGPGAGPGRVSNRPGPDFIPCEPEAGL